MITTSLLRWQAQTQTTCATIDHAIDTVGVRVLATKLADDLVALYAYVYPQHTRRAPEVRSFLTGKVTDQRITDVSRVMAQQVADLAGLMGGE
jgi:hypothetical protein